MKTFLFRIFLLVLFSLNARSGYAQTNEDSTPRLIADKIFDAWYKAYNIESVQGFFWDNAEMMEVVLDAYEVTKDPKYKTMFETMYKNFILKNGADWQDNKYNDDIAWMVLVSVRGYILTGSRFYLDKAKEQFDKMYARAFNYSYGGGMLWYHTKTTKNACINGPSMVACCYLARATGDSAYYNKAISLYTWSKLYLFNASTGKVNDNVDLDLKTGMLTISEWSSTYNQGTKVAYTNRNSQNLIQTKWAEKTSDTKPESAFGCSSAVSLMVNTTPFAE